MRSIVRVLLAATALAGCAVCPRMPAPAYGHPACASTPAGGCGARRTTLAVEPVPATLTPRSADAPESRPSAEPADAGRNGEHGDHR